MPIRRTLLLAVMLAVSLLANAGLGALSYLRGIDVRFYRGGEQARAMERDFLMGLIPTLKPAVSKEELKHLIQKRYPDEEVNVLDEEVQWRLFHFWFDRDGKLVEVQWAS